MRSASLAMSKTSDRAHVCSQILFGGRGSQGCSSSYPLVLFYSHVGQANTRFWGRSLLVTFAATSVTGTDVSPSNVQHDQRL